MKRYGNLFDRICSVENLYQAAENARKGKKQQTVADFYADLDNQILRLREELITGTYRTSEYSVFTVREPKIRVVYKLPFRDRVVQWAILQLLEPIWVAHFTRDTYSNIRGRGIHPLIKKLRHDLRKDPEGTCYALQLDIKQFYPSIDHAILKQVIRRKIKDKPLLALLDGIIDSVEGGRGVPIGNYLSQFYANLYIAELDHLLKEQYGVKYYYRYADDILILSDNKAKLHELKLVINDYLAFERDLSIKGNYQVYPVEARGIDIVGYVVRHGYMKVRKRNKQALCKQVGALRKKGVPEAEI
ncbi:MAG: RNA-directed DNA polymerase [Alistipes sp.]|nr:RNA-directed DNA polymerase [Alistipes sp.]